MTAEQKTQDNGASLTFTPYMVAVSLVGYGVLAWMTLFGPQPAGQLLAVGWKAGFFLALAILVGLNPVRLPRGGATTTVGFAVDFACLLIFGPVIASWIGVLSFLLLLRRSPWLRQTFNHGQVILSFIVAGWVFQLLGGRYIIEGGQVAYERAAPALLGSCLAYFMVSSLLLAAAMALWERRAMVGMWMVNFRWAAPQYVALAPFGLLMAMVYQAYQPQVTPGVPPVPSQPQYLDIIAVSLFLVPLVGARYAFQGAMEMLQVHRETVYALSNALEAYDPYTRNHSELVTRYAVQLGKELGLTASRMEALEWAGRLHDIGKCRQDWEPIIRKPGRPSEREWQIIRQHPIEGSRLAEKMEFLPHTAGVVAKIVRAHHERMDGRGYPDGLHGEEIPLEARILCVADAFEAMTARRSYQPRRSVGEAVQEIRRCAGAQFDAQVTDALGALWQRGELAVDLGSATEQSAAPGLTYQPGGAT